MKKKWAPRVCIVLAVFLILSVLILGGCDTAAPPDDDDDDNGTPAPDPKEEKVINITVTDTAPTLDPHAHRSGASERIIAHYIEALTRLEPDGRHVMALAESITEVDTATYEIKIRRDVTFHNGDPLTADDVVFSLNRVGVRGGWDGADSPKIAQVGNLESVEKIDEYTVRVKLERPRPLTQYANWLHGSIIPKKYFEDVGGITGFLQHPIGTGPFMWVEGDEASRFVFDRYDDYWAGAAKIDRVILHVIREQSTRVAALLAGDVDMIDGVPFDAINLFEANPTIDVGASVTGDVVIMSINTRKAPLNDKKVRQALAYAIDYEKITSQLGLGYTDPLYARPFLPPFEGTPGYGAFDQIPGYEYNPEKAKALLEEAGYGDGFSLVIDTIGHQVEKGQAIAQMWSEIGIDASVRLWEFAVMSGTWREENHNRDIYLSRYANMDRFPDYIANQVAEGRPQNRARYVNPAVDDLLARASALDDSPERNELFVELFEIVMEDMPCIFIDAQGKIAAWNKRVKNYQPCIRVYTNPERLDIE